MEKAAAAGSLMSTAQGTNLGLVAQHPGVIGNGWAAIAVWLAFR